VQKKNLGETVPASPVWTELDAFIREQIQHRFQTLLEDEATAWLGRPRSTRRGVDQNGYRNGFGKPRHLTLGAGTITVRRPRVRGVTDRFVSRLLPLFKRRTPAVTATLPELYLHGLAQGDFTLALRGLLGEAAPVSASTVARLAAQWQAEYDAWQQQPLDGLDVVYAWADGLYVKAGLERAKAALLVVIGALRDGRKVVLAVTSGERESTSSWSAVLRDLQRRGLRAPALWIADGHLGVGGAIRAIYPEGDEQRCWNHRIVNVLDAVPRKDQPVVAAALQRLMYAPSLLAAERGRRQFAQQYRRRYPKAVERLESDWERLVTYYRFPEPHWKHLRTTNVVESPFAAVRLRTTAAKRFQRAERATAMIWKLLQVAERTFRRLNAPHVLGSIRRPGDVKGTEVTPPASKRLAA
jgi:transposase-like protein